MMEKAESLLSAFFVKNSLVFTLCAVEVKFNLLKTQLHFFCLLIKKKKTIKLNICYTN